MPAVEISPYITSGVKRKLDVCISGALLAVGGPLERGAINYLRGVLDEGEDYFVQPRDSIDIVKLRTMNNGRDPDIEGGARHCDRVPSNAARIIRLARIDEIPQLRGVLTGTYSIVSPRPTDDVFNQRCLDVVGIDMFEQWQKVCKSAPVKPGLTSPAQLANLKSEVMDDDYYRLQVENDLQYCADASLALDLKVLAMSVAGVGALVSRNLFNQVSPQEHEAMA
ncbi:MAG: sugar transferase [Candidatus Saccharibacteria bacterium]|nr:sugar transferase [Candidatus Saccharibacteria bacterium]